METKLLDLLHLFSRDTMSSRTSQIKEGLNRMFCLVPYDIITYEVSEQWIIITLITFQITYAKKRCC